MANVSTINKRETNYYEAARFARNDWLPEDYNELLE
jgi:hypothetical protein